MGEDEPITYIDALFPPELRDKLALYYEEAEREDDQLEDEREMRKVDRWQSLRPPRIDDWAGDGVHWMGYYLPNHEGGGQSSMRNRRELRRVMEVGLRQDVLQRRMMRRRDDPEWGRSGNENLQALQVRRWIRKKRDRRLSRK
jgi:hypothetical protein